MTAFEIMSMRHAQVPDADPLRGVSRDRRQAPARIAIGILATHHPIARFEQMPDTSSRRRRSSGLLS